MVLLENRKDVENIEHIDPNVSDKYVPVYSTELIDILAPEFEFKGGTLFHPGSTKHSLHFVTKDGDDLVIYNSYDRRLALGFYLKTGDFNVDVGVDRLIHMGQRAKDFAEALENSKADILKNIKNTKTMMYTLAKEEVDATIAANITNIVFGSKLFEGRERKATGVQIVNPADMLLEIKEAKDQTVSVKGYIDLTLRNFYEGNYTYLVNGVKKVGRPTKQLFQKVTIQNKLVKFLKETYPELFL